MKLALWDAALARILLSDLVGNTQARPHPPVIRRAWSTLDRDRVESQLIQWALGSASLLQVPCSPRD